MLKTNTTLNHLDLEDNKIGDGSAGAIADALTTNISLTHLLLGRNNMRELVAIADALKKNETLERLDVDGNKIDCDGAVAFAKAIKVNFTLRDLGLGNNNIGDRGLLVLAVGLKENSALEKLCLINNDTGDLWAPFMDTIESTLWMNNEERFVQTLRGKLARSTKTVSTIDCLTFPSRSKSFESWKARRLGESLQEHAGLTVLKIRFEESWDDR